MMSLNIWIWVAGISFYALFWLWYNGVSGALTDQEITEFTNKLRMNSEFAEREAVVLEFMQSDNGKQFVMQNLISYHKTPVEHPDTKETMTAPELLNSYYQPFSVELFKRAGHPVFTGRAQQRNIEQWGVNDAVEWQGTGLIRYRSRRDLMELILHPKFNNIHTYKKLALSQTLAFPVQPLVGFYASPNVWMAMLLMILCSSAHLVYLTYFVRV